MVFVLLGTNMDNLDTPLTIPLLHVGWSVLQANIAMDSL